jgi:hypothetical protein
MARLKFGGTLSVEPVSVEARLHKEGVHVKYHASKTKVISSVLRVDRDSDRLVIGKVPKGACLSCVSHRAADAPGLDLGDMAIVLIGTGSYNFRRAHLQPHPPRRVSLPPLVLSAISF